MVIRTLIVATYAAFLLATACGFENPQRAAVSITGGMLTDEFPAVGALRLENGKTICSGTLVKRDKVLTAAHCVKLIDKIGLDSMPLDFAMGPDASNPVETVQVVSILLHPSYRDNNSEHDLAVVTLDRPTDQIPLAILQTPHLAIEGRSLLFVGYGADNGDDASGIGFKRRAEIAVVKVEAETFLSQTESKNSCTGDSGGPAFMRIDERNYRQVGVISRGDKRCLSHGVNTRLDTNSTFLKDLFD